MAAEDEQSGQPGPAWHALSADDALERLESSAEGLSQRQRRERLDEHGANTLPEESRPGVWLLFLRQFRDPLIYILLVAAVVSLATGYFNNAIFIGAVLLFNAGIGTWQEARAEASAGALQQALRIRARVRVGGSSEEVDAEDLVPGDVIEVGEGDSVPADARLLEARELRVDESLLTGESTPVEKQDDAEVDEDAVVAERPTIVHAGSMVLSGRATAVVCRTGTDTGIGSIAASLAEGESQVPPLVIRLRRFTRMIAICTMIAIAILGVIQWLRGETWLDIFFLGVALAVSAIPAGLPVAITVALSIASKRMAERNVIVRQLPAVEGLGACTCIASDKTGTLTANQLTAQRLWLPEHPEVIIGGEGLILEGELRCGESGDEDCDEQTTDAARSLALSGALCNEAELLSADSQQDRDENGGEVEPERDEGAPALRARGDTVDVAFLVLAGKLGFDREELLAEHEEIGAIPFSSERRFAASFHRHDGDCVAHVKGAAETVAEMCGIDAERVAEAEEALAGEGYRVLAVAAGTVDESAADDESGEGLDGLDFLGLVGLIDPIRPEVGDAVARCRRAGIEVRMITGDHPTTGRAIAREIGLGSGDHGEEERDDGERVTAITGSELAELEEEEERDRRVAAAAVFARVEPTQKVDIVASLQRQGHFVAVTGDGANDAPALKEAHIGVAMGRGGTDVARNTADLILTDDNFASIVNGVEEGRIAYSNVRKVTWLLISTGTAEVLLFFLAVGFGHPIPLLPVQLLWLNLVTNGIQDVALAFEKGEPELLAKAPRDPDEPIFNRRMIEQVLSSGCYIGSVAFVVYHYFYHIQGLEVDAARNLTLLLMVLFENVHIFSCRSEHRSLFKINFWSNPLLLVTVLIAQGVHIATMFIPGLSDVLGMSPVALSDWLALAPIALSLILFDEIVKLWHRRRER